MTRQVLYVARPLAPSEEEILAVLPRFATNLGLAEWTARYPDDVGRLKRSALQDNLQRALRWLAWLRRSFPETTFIAPWIASVMSGEDDADPAQREAGLVDDCAVVERCDGIVLCGGRISSGMRREMEHRISNGHRHQDSRIESFAVYDLTRVGIRAPNESDGAWLPDPDYMPDQAARVASGACAFTWVTWAACFRV